MGRILETIGGFATNPGATLTAVTMASGDSATLRNVSAPGDTALLRVARGGATAGAVAVISPNMHDSTRGIQFPTAEAITPFSFPRDAAQPMVPGDALTIQVSGGGAETDAALLLLEYNNASVGGGRFCMPGDFKGMIRNVKLMEVDLNTTATGSAWKDQLFNTTEDLLHQGSDYAVLGMTSDVSVLGLGVKGPDTGNYRVALPSLNTLENTAEQYVRLSEYLGRPCIPVISGANRYQSFVSAFHYGAGTAIKTTLVLAELTQRLTLS